MKVVPTLDKVRLGYNVEITSINPDAGKGDANKAKLLSTAELTRCDAWMKPTR
jgi:hypothetical protein